MKRRTLAAAIVTCLAVVAASAPARAVGVGQELAFNVKFDFTADEKVFKAGEYMISGDSKGTGELRIQRADGKFHNVLTPMTRLARQHQGDAPKASLVFDTVGDKHILSEVWLPGQDGYLLRPAKEAHEHDVVDVK